MTNMVVSVKMCVTIIKVGWIRLKMTIRMIYKKLSSHKNFTKMLSSPKTIFKIMETLVKYARITLRNATSTLSSAWKTRPHYESEALAAATPPTNRRPRATPPPTTIRAARQNWSSRVGTRWGCPWWKHTLNQPRTTRLPCLLLIP